MTSIGVGTRGNALAPWQARHVSGAPHLHEPAAAIGADVLGVCWRAGLDEVAARVGPEVALQGNLDPQALFTAPDEVARFARGVLARMDGRPGHIMNLGHGILPETPIESVEALVQAVHDHVPSAIGEVQP